MKSRLLPLVLLFCVTVILMSGALQVSATQGGAEPEVYFQMPDPAGDEHGYGTYVYPVNLAFKPYQGLFDILNFRVVPGPAGAIWFDTTFQTITNPWAAPEGFIHQNLRIYVDSIPGEGQTKLPEPGAYVQFNPKYAWDFCLKVVGWGNSRLITVQNGKLKQQPLETELLGDHQTIRASIPENLYGKPTKKWNYYVIVGSYDGFGEDFFRKVMAKSEEWVIGGGFDEAIEPQALDILAPERGPHSQQKQLNSFDRETKTLAELYPVGPELAGSNLRKWLLILITLIFVSGIAYLIIAGPRNIVWFWVKKLKAPVDKGEV